MANTKRILYAILIAVDEWRKRMLAIFSAILVSRA
jgi:hypothetical protein